MVRRERKLGGKRYILSDHSLSREEADRLKLRHKRLGLNAQVREHAKGKWAVYRRCSLRKMQAEARRRMKRVHVNQFMIRANQKTKARDRRPVISIQTSEGSIRANNVQLEGDSQVKYTPDDKLSCGSKPTRTV